MVEAVLKFGRRVRGRHVRRLLGLGIVAAGSVVLFHDVIGVHLP